MISPSHRHKDHNDGDDSLSNPPTQLLIRSSSIPSPSSSPPFLSSSPTTSNLFNSNRGHDPVRVSVHDANESEDDEAEEDRDDTKKHNNPMDSSLRQISQQSGADDSDPAMKDRYRIAIIADPQLTDWYSYRQTGFVLRLVQIYTDLYMRRSFRRLHSSLRPDAVLFLGDLNDGGRSSQGQVFEEDSHRFYERVFATKSTAWNQEPVIMDETEGKENSITGHYSQVRDIPETAADRQALRDEGRSLRLYVAGNHDVGIGNTLVRSSMIRFKKIFGSVNYEIEVGNHTLVVLDTLSLSSDITEIRQESQLFLNQMEQETPTLPRILFTHVPLFRSDTTDCGDARETKQLILNRSGDQYRNMVNATLSRQILRGIQPDIVFSGDDHDWCEIAHSLDGTLTPEVTLRTFSFAQGIQRPSFVMLSLFNPEHIVKNTLPVMPEPGGFPVGGLDLKGSSSTVTRPTRESTSFVYEECMLPNQMKIYLVYGILLAISVGCVLIQRYRWFSSGDWSKRQRQVLGRLGMYFSVATTATTTMTMTTMTSSSSRSQLREHEDEAGVDGLDQTEVNRSSRPGTYNNGSSKSTWPLLTSVYWKLVAWDLANVALGAILFYLFLFLLSML
ncbi:hypothetical protein BGZ83_007960 [Gryganskiella cystojenkinii]|nr:hypothetical protein BGZ83_007960 [Gryganskiella cystojenkinii]